MAAVQRFPRRQILGGTPRRADHSGLEQEAYALPHLAVGELAAGDERFGERHAGFGQFARRVPLRADFGQRRFVLLPPARLQRVAGDLVVVRDQQRMLGAEQIPLLLLAQHLQPLPAHLLGEQAPLLAREESAHFLRSGILEARAQQPGFDIGFEQVTLQLRVVPGELVVVARARSGTRGKEDLILRLRA